MALAEVTTAVDVEMGDRRWAEWWAWPRPDTALGGALLDVYESWNGDDTIVSHTVYQRFLALDRRMLAYETWCSQVGIEPSRRPVHRSLRVVDGDERVLCTDCGGSTIVVDEDGSLSGSVGTLVDCLCAELPSLGVVQVCETALARSLTEDERHVAVIAEYLAHCRMTGADPAWCLHCGEYRPSPDADCGCTRV
jgi:hypothetical protein